MTKNNQGNAVHYPYGTLWLVLVFIVSGCASKTVTTTLTNRNPMADSHLQQFQVTLPKNWHPTQDETAITNGNFIVSLLTLSAIQANPDDILRDGNKRLHESRTRTIAIEYRNTDTLVAWFVLDDATMVTLILQSRTPVIFTQTEEDLLVTIASSVVVMGNM